MATVQTPKINRIIRLTEFDLLRTAIKQYNMYMCLDSGKLYYDVDTSRRVVYAYTSVKTLNDLQNNVIPSLGVTYYCWEDNSLWLWMNRWISIYSDSTYPSAYAYDDEDNLTEIYRYGLTNLPADDNGLLKDGSVVIRDRNRIIKGKMYIADNNDNFVLSSYLGGGMLFLPNGKMSEAGTLYLSDFDIHNDSQETEETKYSYLKSQLHIIDNELYVDYSQNPGYDDNLYQNDSHLYKVYHEGNLDSAALEILTPLDLYNKLLDSSLPNPLQFNVTKLNGKTDEDFALKVHTHTSSDITDFNTAAQQQAEISIRSVLNTIDGKGIDITFYSADSRYVISANDFNINLTGGVYGVGTVQHLDDVTIHTTVDPNQHIHQNYIDRMDLLQDQINNLVTIDPEDYYTKPEVDNLISEITGTTVPTAGKPLLVNDSLVLPGIAQTAQALDHNIQLNLIGEATGGVSLDTTQNSLDLNVTLVPGDNILQSKDLGVLVPTLDASGKIPIAQIPDITAGLTPMGNFNPNEGLPTTTPEEGQFWVASTEGSVNGELYQVGDWCAYLNSEWVHISTNSAVLSVNGKTGTVTLNYDDVNAISSEYINYTIGSTIPANKIVITNENGQISGASVNNLTNPFTISTDTTTDIEILSTSSQTSTDGSNNIGLSLGITEQGYQNIRQNASYQLQANGGTLDYLPAINFANGFNVVQQDNITTISVADNTSSNIIAIDYDNITRDQLGNTLTGLYPNRDTTSIIIYAKTDDGEYVYFTINKDTPTLTEDQQELQVVLQPNTVHTYCNQTTNNISIEGKTYTLTLTLTKTTYDITVTVGDLVLHNNRLGTAVTESYVQSQLENICKGFQTIVSISPDNLEYTIPHNLGTRFVYVCCRLQDTGEEIFVQSKATDANTLQLVFDQPASINNLIVTIIGVM